MNKYVKKGFCLALAVGLIATSFSGCAKINYVTDAAIQAIHEIKDDSWQNTDTDDSTGTDDMDTAVIDEFVANTYGGVEFASEEDVLNYYNTAYDATKAQTCEYIDSDGNTQVFYAMLGEESLQVTDILIEGKENSVINNLVPSIVGGLYSPGLNGLTPSTNRNPDLDVDDNGESLQTSRATIDDVAAINVSETDDGMIEIQIQPKSVNMSQKGMDAQGHFFNSLGAIDATVESISVLSWASGTTAENCVVNYYGGMVDVVIDPSTGLITSGTYHMLAHIDVTHATVTVIKDKSASLLVTYDVTFPASAEYMQESKGVSVK